MALQLAAEHPAVEHERVERNAREAEAQAVEHGDERDGLDLDARLLVDLLHRHLRRRVPDVSPSDRVQPHTRVGPLREQDLTGLVGDHGGDRDLRCHITGDPVPHGRQPLLEQGVALGLLDRGRPNVGRDLQHLLEALLLVEALREPEAGARDAGNDSAQRNRSAAEIASGSAMQASLGRPSGWLGQPVLARQPRISVALS